MSSYSRVSIQASFTNLIVPDTTLRTYDSRQDTTTDHVARSRSKETIRRCNTESKFSDMMKLPWRVINDVGKCKKREVGETWEGPKTYQQSTRKY